MPCSGYSAQHGVKQQKRKKKKKKDKELLVKNIKRQSFFGKRVIYNYFTFSSLNTKLNRYQVPAEFGKSFVFLYLGFKTAFKEARNFLKKNARNEVKMEEVVDVKREEILSSPELKYWKKAL